ncbi:hypothetical protein [Actinacidiphila sp. bgisy145]|uniref:hypothetical protein n=1 Tax=Actinacidiphila sp. bgisy145 TaxID=3413792 RepID=UPI003EBDA45F
MAETMRGAAPGEPVADGPAPQEVSQEVSWCADLAGIRLYRRNAFAVTGLPADTRESGVQRFRQEWQDRQDVAATWPGAAGSPLAGPFGAQEVRAALEAFSDPRRRLADELLWLWDGAALGCSCPDPVHRRHDEAVRCHALALEAAAGHREAAPEERVELWGWAADAWGALCGGPEFARHVAERVRALGDARFGAVEADEVVAAVPRLLVSPFREMAADADLAPGLPELCARWARHAVFAGPVTEVFEEVAREGVRTVAEGLAAVERKRADRGYQDAVLLVEQEVVPAFEQLTRLGPLVPAPRCEEAAHLLAAGLDDLVGDLQDHYVGLIPNGKQRRTVIELAEKAYAVAPEPDRKALERKRDVVRRQFGGSGPVPALETATQTRLRQIGCLSALLLFVVLLIFNGPMMAAAGTFLTVIIYLRIRMVFRLVQWLVRRVRRLVRSVGDRRSGPA